MKRLVCSFLLIMVLNCVSFAGAGREFNNPCIYKTSFTTTNDSYKGISNATYLYSVLIGSASPGGLLWLYDCYGTTMTAHFTVIDLNSQGQYTYNLYLSSGLTYRTSGNSNGLNIIYRGTW